MSRSVTNWFGHAKTHPQTFRFLCEKNMWLQLRRELHHWHLVNLTASTLIRLRASLARRSSSAAKAPSESTNQPLPPYWRCLQVLSEIPQLQTEIRWYSTQISSETGLLLILVSTDRPAFLFTSITTDVESAFNSSSLLLLLHIENIWISYQQLQQRHNVPFDLFLTIHRIKGDSVFTHLKYVTVSIDSFCMLKCTSYHSLCSLLPAYVFNLPPAFYIQTPQILWSTTLCSMLTVIFYCYSQAGEEFTPKCQIFPIFYIPAKNS